MLKVRSRARRKVQAIGNPTGEQPRQGEADPIGNPTGEQPRQGEADPIENRSAEQPVPNHESEPDKGEASENPIGEAENDLCQVIMDWDDGQKRVRLKHKISLCYPNDRVRENEEDEEEDEAEDEVEGLEECSNDSTDEIPLDQLLRVKKRKREVACDVKGKKEKRSRGPSKPRASAHREFRPSLKVVGEGEFEATPTCTKIHATLRNLLFEHMPFPARTYNIFPAEVRLTVLKKILKVYSWESGQWRQRCIDVYENVAADVYKEALVRLRKQYTKQFGASPSLWKAHPPQWCMKKVWVWQGLCDLYETEGWKGLSKTNCANKALDGGVAHHVAGPRSKHQVEQQLGVVTSKDVFDKMHKKVLPDGTSVYANPRLADVAV